MSVVNDENVKAGYILSEDAEANIFEAEQSGILNAEGKERDGDVFHCALQPRHPAVGLSPLSADP